MHVEAKLKLISTELRRFSVQLRRQVSFRQTVEVCWCNYRSFSGSQEKAGTMTSFGDKPLAR